LKTLAFRDDDHALPAANVAAEVVENGGLVLIPTETFYGLGADPLQSEAVARVFAAKGRPGSLALPVLCADWQQLESLVVVPEEHRVRMARLWPAALTVVLRCRRSVPAGPEGTLAVRIPGHAIVRAVLYRTGPITGTSANRHGEPPCTEPEAALASIATSPDLVLDGGTLPGGKPSTLVDLTAAEPTVLRQGSVLWDEPFPWDDPQ
jgi:L-threonylcarbamoyladenylate synthase